MELMIDTNVILDIILKRNKYTESEEPAQQGTDLSGNGTYFYAGEILKRYRENGNAIPPTMQMKL